MSAFENCEMKSGDGLKRHEKVVLGLDKRSSVNELGC